MPLPTTSRPKPQADSDPLFRYERDTPLVGGGRQTVTVVLTRRSVGWVILSSFAVVGGYQNIGTFLPLLRRMLFP